MLTCFARIRYQLARRITDGSRQPRPALRGYCRRRIGRGGRIFIDRCRPDFDYQDELSRVTMEQEDDLRVQQAKLQDYYAQRQVCRPSPPCGRTHTPVLFADVGGAAPGFFWRGVCSYSGSSNRNGSSSKMQAARLVRPKRVRPTRPLRPTRTLRGAGAHGGLQTKRHTTRTPSRKSRLSCVSDRVWSFWVPRLLSDPNIRTVFLHPMRTSADMCPLVGTGCRRRGRTLAPGVRASRVGRLCGWWDGPSRARAKVAGCR